MSSQRRETRARESVQSLSLSFRGTNPLTLWHARRHWPLRKVWEESGRKWALWLKRKVLFRYTRFSWQNMFLVYNSKVSSFMLLEDKKDKKDNVDWLCIINSRILIISYTYLIIILCRYASLLNVWIILYWSISFDLMKE